MSTVKLGLIGLGEWPREAYVPVLKELDTARVCAVAARTEATRTFAQEQFGRDIALYGDYRELLADEAVDAVMVALPNEMHREGIKAAVESGKHVFFEPPIGHTAEEASDILAVMAASDRVVQADHELRYLPVVSAAQALLASGGVGEPLMAKVRLWANWGYGGGKWNQNPEEEGFFPWLGCWYLDLLDCVFPASPQRVNVTGGYAMNGAVMDHGLTTVDYGRGVGEFEFSLVAVDGLSVALSVLATGGELEAELTTGALRWRSEDGEWQEAVHDCSRPMHGFVGMRESITDFVAAVRDGRPANADVAVTRRVHEGMLACARSEHEKRRVVVDALG